MPYFAVASSLGPRGVATPPLTPPPTPPKPCVDEAPSPSPSLSPSPKAALDFDVLCNVFGYLRGSDMRQVSCVSRLWRQATTTGPALHAWHTESNRVIQNFVHNKMRATNVFEAASHSRLFQDIIARQRSLDLCDVDHGLNAYRMQQAFAVMPALRHLRLRRSRRGLSKGAAFTSAEQRPSIHQTLLRQSVPPKLWTGALPERLTHLDVSQFQLYSSYEIVGRPVYENDLITGLNAQLSEHAHLTHLSLGAFHANQLVLPPQLTHLTLNEPVTSSRAYESMQVVTEGLLERLPKGLTHLHAGGALRFSPPAPGVVPPSVPSLECLSTRVHEEEWMGLTRLFHAPLSRLDVVVRPYCFKTRVALPPRFEYPDTLRALGLDVGQTSHSFREEALRSLPTTLETLTIGVKSTADFGPVHARLAALTRLNALRLVMSCSIDDAPYLAATLRTLPPTCRNITVAGVREDVRRALETCLLAQGQSIAVCV